MAGDKITLLDKNYTGIASTLQICKAGPDTRQMAIMHTRALSAAINIMTVTMREDRALHTDISTATQIQVIGVRGLLVSVQGPDAFFL